MPHAVDVHIHMYTETNLNFENTNVREKIQDFKVAYIFPQSRLPEF